MNQLEKNIINGNKMRSTKLVAQKLFFDNLTSISIDNQLSLSVLLKENIFSSSFFRKIERNNSPLENYKKLVIHGFRNIEIKGNRMQVSYGEDRGNYTRLILSNFIVSWANFNDRFEQDEEFNTIIVALFKKLLKESTHNDLYSSIKEYIRHEEYFNYLRQDDRDEINYLIYEYYMNNENVNLNEIALSSELIMSSTKFKNSLKDNQKYGYKIELINVKALIKNIYLKDFIEVYIKNIKGEEKFRELKFSGFSSIIRTKITESFDDLKIAVNFRDLDVNNIISLLPVKTRMFLIENINLELVDIDFLIQFEDFIDQHGDIREETKDLFRVMYST